MGHTENSESSASDRPLAVVVSILLLSIIVSIGWGIIQRPHLRGLRTHSDSSLGTLLTEEQSTLETRYAFFGFLHDAATGGTLVVPDLSVVNTELVANLAHMDIVVEDYDPVIPSIEVEGLDTFASGIGAVADNGDEAFWTILTVGDGAATRMTYFEAGFVVVLAEQVEVGE